ncbi:TIGR01212 family radical SAM protein, partial [Clostridium sp.]|uniref:TIGR01212 family radical SAM protein n=1 Tax=Clostridium sp. TaxID=1506 RepID=UPI00307D7FB8
MPRCYSDGRPYYSLNAWLKDQFGQKIYKLALDGGMTCPNRDGTLGTGGCIFCSHGGSGDFAEPAHTSVTEQIEAAKARVANKIKDGKYVAYFQSYTNTYAPVSYLEPLFSEAIAHPDVAALSIGTRPDCLPPDVLELLARLNRQKPVWVELGLQTIHEESAARIQRGYSLPVFENAVRE